MIIPPRCFTCGTVIGDKWKPFVKNVLEEKEKSVKHNNKPMIIFIFVLIMS